MPVSAPLSTTSHEIASKPSTIQHFSDLSKPTNSTLHNESSQGNLDPKMLDTLYKPPQTKPLFKPKTRSNGRFRPISRSKSRSRSRSRSHRRHRSNSRSYSRSSSPSSYSSSYSYSSSDAERSTSSRKGVSSQKSESPTPSSAVVRRLTQLEKRKLAKEKRKLKRQLQQEFATRKKRFAIDETPSNSTPTIEIEPVSVSSNRNS